MMTQAIKKGLSFIWNDYSAFTSIVNLDWYDKSKR